MTFDFEGYKAILFMLWYLSSSLKLKTICWASKNIQAKLMALPPAFPMQSMLYPWSFISFELLQTRTPSAANCFVSYCTDLYHMSSRERQRWRIRVSIHGTFCPPTFQCRTSLFAMSNTDKSLVSCQVYTCNWHFKKMNYVASQNLCTNKTSSV